MKSSENCSLRKKVWSFLLTQYDSLVRHRFHWTLFKMLIPFWSVLEFESIKSLWEDYKFLDFPLFFFAFATRRIWNCNTMIFQLFFFALGKMCGCENCWDHFQNRILKFFSTFSSKFHFFSQKQFSFSRHSRESIFTYHFTKTGKKMNSKVKFCFGKIKKNLEKLGENIKSWMEKL
jgi:hypothetical protein